MERGGKQSATPLWVAEKRRRRCALPAQSKCTTMIATVLLLGLGVYLACGLVFAIAFALVGVKKIDPHAAHGSWGFRLLIIPGTMVFWPLLLKRWIGGAHEPPEEHNAHRLATKAKT